MKKLYLLFVFLLSCHTIWAQQIAWERTYGTPTTEIIRCEPLPDGGFGLLLIDGFSMSVSRLDSAGIEIWNEPLGSEVYMSYSAFVRAVPGGILVGLQDVSQADTLLPLLVKFNMQGTELWRKRLYTGRTFNTSADLHIRSANEYLLMAAGFNMDQPGGGAKYIAFSVDSTGEVNWRKNYFEDSLSYAYPKNIINYRHNGYMFCGDLAGNGFHPYVIKTNEEGNVLQEKKLVDPPGVVDAYSITYGNFIPLSDRAIAFTGFNFVNDNSQRYVLVSKADTALNVLWTVTHAEPEGFLSASRIVEMEDSTILLITQKHNQNKVILVKISPEGQLLDTTYINTSNPTYAISVRDAFLLPDSSLIYAGRDFIIKVKNIGLPMVLPPHPIDTATSISVAFPISNQPQVKLYPNPAPGSVQVQLVNTRAGGLLQLYSVTGKLVLQRPITGATEEISLQGLPKGLYLYRVQAAETVWSGKLVVSNF